MPVRIILTPFDGSDEAVHVMETALVVAQRFGAHVRALHIRPNPSDSAPFMFDRLSGALRTSVLGEAERAARARSAEARRRFDAFCNDHALAIVDGPENATFPSAGWIEEPGRISEALVRHARLADVVAMARPLRRQGTVRRSAVGENLEAIMLGAGRPVIIVPPDWAARRVEHAAIGWNESLEASRALATTLPWLTQMTTVTVLASRKREAGANRLTEYLAWHGIDAKVRLLDGAGESVGDAMLAVCADAGIEFLVVGGYSRARSRQLLFGGVTQHLLRRAEILTVMVH